MEHHANHPSPSGIAPAQAWWVNSRGIHPRWIRTGTGFEQVPFIEGFGEQAGILDRNARQPRAGSECRRDLLPENPPNRWTPVG